MRLSALRGRAVAGPVILIPQGPGGVLALDRRCTHLGCPVGLDARGLTLVCPCHGSAFDLTGARIHGPATRPLRRLKVVVDEQGRLRVHGPA